VCPSIGFAADVLEGIDNIIRRSSPFIAAGVFVGSFYWTACTYGAITVLQVLGKKFLAGYLEINLI
jgi:E3 ubiquitin-protein ligase MARCH5